MFFKTMTLMKKMICPLMMSLWELASIMMKMMMNFCNNFIIIIIVISFSKVCNVITLWKILLLSYYQCIYRNYLQIFATCMVVNFSQVSIFWMASSSQRRTRNVSSMPSSTLSLQRQRMPQRSSMVPSQIQSEPPSSQPSGESSTLQPTCPFPSHARRPRPEPSSYKLID